MNRQTLDRAIARYHLQQKQAVPTAKACYEAFLAGTDPPEIPEADSFPSTYPYTVLSERKARQLAFITAALPDKAADLQALFLLTT